MKRRGLLALVVLPFFVACANPCTELANTVCDKVSAQATDCAALPKGDVDACTRMKSVVASCGILREKAEAAGPEDRQACEADLELVRALERAQN